MKKVLLVQAPVFIARCPPNALALLSAHLRRAGLLPSVRDSSSLILSRMAGPGTNAGWESLGGLEGLPQRLSSRLERLIEEEALEIAKGSPDIVGFSVLTGTETCSLKLARAVKKRTPSTTIVFGGPQCGREAHALDYIQEDFIDAVALGEADESFTSFTRAFEPGRPLPKIRGLLVKNGGILSDGGDPQPIESLDALPFMDFSGFEPARYPGKTLHLSTSRGCVRTCAFCTHIVIHKTFRNMSAARVVSEIEHHLERRPDLDYIEFGDSLINGDVRRLEEFSERMISIRLDRAVRGQNQNVGWGGMAILHKTMSPALLLKMRRGGCRVLFYGLESGSQRVVNLMKKNFSIEDAESVLENTKKASIAVSVFLMAGFPGETEDDFRQTLAFLRRNAAFIDRASTSLCEIQKGSELDVRAASFGIETPVLDGREWRMRDGSNDGTIRRERHARLLAELDALGISRNPHATTRITAPH